MDYVWLVEQWLEGQPHELQGIFSSKEKAVAACVLDTFCVTRVFRLMTHYRVRIMSESIAGIRYAKANQRNKWGSIYCSRRGIGCDEMPGANYFHLDIARPADFLNRTNHRSLTIGRIHAHSCSTLGHAGLS